MTDAEAIQAADTFMRGNHYSHWALSSDGVVSLLGTTLCGRGKPVWVVEVAPPVCPDCASIRASTGGAMFGVAK